MGFTAALLRSPRCQEPIGTGQGVRGCVLGAEDVWGEKGL